MPTLDERTRELLRMQLVRHEGLKLFPYRDRVGKLTIGVGRNLDDVGVSAAESYYLLDNDIDRVDVGLSARFPGWFPSLDPIRQAAIVNMAFNLGVPRFAAFPDTIAALELGDYTRAAVAMLNSRWAGQVGPRARELARQVAAGAWQGPAPKPA